MGEDHELPLRRCIDVAALHAPLVDGRATRAEKRDEGEDNEHKYARDSIEVEQKACQVVAVLRVKEWRKEAARDCAVGTRSVAEKGWRG